jgi:hemerythrin-like domain-containing protein
MANNEQPQVQVKIEPAQEQGVYANAVSVHVNQNEVILDFGYIMPNVKPMAIKVVSRMNLTHQTAESFMNVLSNAMLDWRNRQKSENKKN